MKAFIFSLIILTITLPLHAQTRPESVTKAHRLFERLTGTPIPSNDPRFFEMVKLINDGDEEKAAAIATDDPYFYQVTLKQFASVMSNRSETPFVPLDDFQATLIGAVRDDLDARTLLTGNYIYVATPKTFEGLLAVASRRNNSLYETIDGHGLFYKDVLVKQDPQWEGFKNHAGLLTTRGWAKAHYDAGTNRRAVQYAFQEFLCLPIDSWKVAGLIDDFVGRDVNHSPGDDPKVYQEQCKTCHAGMDSMRDAFSQLDYLNDGFVELPEGRVAPKYSRGSSTYPTGHVTKDDSFINLIAHHQPGIGFKKDHGKGINEFGDMLANTEAFKECMAQRVFTAVCQRSVQGKDLGAIKVLARDFAQNGYNLKKLFQKAAVLPACLGE